MRSQSQRPYGRLFPGRRRPLAIGFDPRSLFRNGEQGVIYDPNDLSTLFQDSAGTTPVTAVGQPVGLMLDKSRGLVRGAELLGTGVPAMAGVSDIAEYNASTGAGTAYRSDQYNQSFVNIPGLSMANWYFVDVTNTGANTLSVRADLASGSAFFSVPAGQRKAGFARNVTTVVITSDADVSGVAFTVNSVRSVAGNHAFQPTAASRPMLRQNATTGAYYLETDGSDDWMQTNAIDFTGTDKVSVFCGIRNLNSAAVIGAVCELGPNTSTTNGTFCILSPSSSVAVGATDFQTRGTAFSLARGITAAPANLVLSGLGDIGGDSAVLRINGAQAAQSAADQGTGNYGNYPLYLFRRGGTTLPFNGHFYGLTIVGRLTTDAETRNVERLYANKTGVTLA